MKLMIIVTWIATGLALAQSKPSLQNAQAKQQPAKALPAPTESPEHALARKTYESVREQFTDSQKKYNNQIQQDSSCKPFPDQIRHPVTVASVDQYMIGCAYETRQARYVMDKVEEGLKQAETRLRDVDECLRIYHATIDKKISDQTMRESLQIKACQAEDLYPAEAEAPEGKR